MRSLPLRTIAEPQRPQSLGRGYPRPGRRFERGAAVLLALVTLAGCRGGDPAARPAPAAGGTATWPAVIVNDSLGVEDRCVTCHSGVLDPGRKLAPQPLTAHPGRLLEIHSPLRFGCTPCHQGNGRAAGADLAHTGGKNRRGFLTGDATEISCGKCHVNETDLDGAPHLSHGRALIRRAQCDGCHEIGEFARNDRPGPDLHGIAGRTNPAWLFRWIKNPRDYADNARMPRFRLEDRYVDALVGYLMTFRVSGAVDTSGFPAGDSDRGKNLVRMSFCISCHTIEGKGGKDAIDLGRVGSKLNRAWLLHLVSATHAADPGSPMPQYRFTPSQVADVAAYLSGELSDASFTSPDADSGLAKLGTFWPTEAQRVETGRRVFKELRCGNCHAFPGGEQWIRVAPILSRLGEKNVSEISWGTAPFPHTLEDYVWRKVQTPRVFETAPHQLKMPTYDFTAEEARDVAIALLAQSDPQLLPDAFVVRDRSEERVNPPAEFGQLVDRYRCFSCHAVNGAGHNIAYDLGVEGSRVTKEWLCQYLKLPYTIRPILPVRMPIFNLTDEEVHTLADGIASSWRSARIDSAGDFTAGPAEVEAGRKLFAKSGCLGCHQVGSTGGYVGPGLTSGVPIARRLRPGWIVCWLENPQALKRDAVEPRYGFTEAQARALAAYLASLPGTDTGGSP
jgi:mono/diheme cytochrome c family protein